jgi:hypothetical protein
MWMLSQKGVETSAENIDTLLAAEALQDTKLIKYH